MLWLGNKDDIVQLLKSDWSSVLSFPHKSSVLGSMRQFFQRDEFSHLRTWHGCCSLSRLLQQDKDGVNG